MSLTPEQAERFAPLLEKAEAEGWAEWVQSDRDRLAMLDGHYFDVKAAEHFRDFCARYLRIEHPQTGELVPFILTDWQYRDIVGPLFGWMRTDGFRRYRFGFITVAAGNSKSALAAACLLYLTFADGEPIALSYACSTSASAARTVYDLACRMVRNSPPLMQRLKIMAGTGRIVSLADPQVQLRVAPNNEDAIEGKDVHAAVYDEIHIAKTRDLFDALSQRFRRRTQPMFLVITLAATDTGGIAYELFDDADKIMSGAVVDHSRFAYIASADPEDDILDPATWRKANPGLGFCVNEHDMASEAKLAADSPAKKTNFLRRRLNVWGVGGVETFLDIDKWLACRSDVDPADLAGRDCYAGLDMSSNVDLTSLVLTFPADDGSVDVLAYHWLPRDVIGERTKTDNGLYPQWVRDGHLELTEGDFIDQSYIRQRIIELGRQFNIKEIAYDPTFAADLGPKLGEDGFTVFEFWQRARMFTPVLAKLDELVRAGKIRHRNPLLDWQASNLQVRTNEDGHMKPAKPRRGQKIDGMVSLLMSLGQVVKQQSGDKKAVYYEHCPVLIV